MRSCFVLLFASLLTSCEAQGTFETPVFVLKGRDLLLKLHADPPEGFLYVEWKTKQIVTLVRFDSSGKAAVTERLELGGKNFSVILKNLQEVDSGVYSAVAGTSTGDKLVSEYKVTVQGPVSPVQLTVDRVDSSSSESCDLHVTCRTHNSHISSTFKCPKGVCSQEGGERSEVTTSGASLQVYLLKSTIICDHRNKVHWTQDLVPAEPLCPSKPDPASAWKIVTCILTVILIVLLVLIVWFLNRQRRIIRYGRRLIERIQNVTQTKRERQLLEELNKKKALGEKMTELERRLLDLLKKKVPSREKMTKRERQLLNVLTQKAASKKNMDELDLQLLDVLTQKEASGEKMTKLDLQSLDHLTQKAASGEKMTKRDLQSLDHLNKKKALGEKMEELDLQSLDHLTQKAASGEKMAELERQLLDLLTQKAASREKMEEPEPLNKTSISSSFVKPDAGSIQP